MADQHIGYPGSVNSAQLANWLPNAAAAQYSVDGLSDAQVVVNAIGDRGVTVKAGTVIGDGILDVFENDTNLNHGSVASGPDRWDMIVLRRTWNATAGLSTSIYTIIPGGPNKSLPARNTNKGVVADQPIALCRIKAGSASVQEIVDLRVWAHNGGVVARDELVMSYLNQPGTHLTINDQSWVRLVVPSGTDNALAWLKTGGFGRISLWGKGSPSIGNSAVPTSLGDAFLVQSGQAVVTTDSNAFGKITWPRKFPTGLLTCFLQPADDTGFNDMNAAIAGASWGTRPANEVYVAFRIWGAINNVRSSNWPNRTVRINWLAIGW